MDDWRAFTEWVPWFLRRHTVAEASPRNKPVELSPVAATRFPRLAELLSIGTVTDVSANGCSYELIAWDSANGNRMGWLCLPPSADTPRNLHKDHQLLLASFGGIVERFNEPDDTWLLNLNDTLTEREAATDAGFIEHYRWAFEEAGLVIPIDPSQFYSIAQEANGNTTFCHRVTGQVLMFAPDHDFDHLTVLEGSPEYALYRINGAAMLREWVNAVADQWLAHVATSA